MKEKRRGSRAGSRTSGTCPGHLCGQSWEKLKCGAESRRKAMAKRKAAPKEDIGRSEAPAKAPDNSVYIGQSVKPEFIYLRLANRHGLITGATGTGKTVTLQGLAENFSNQGVPVFCADVKGDLSGIAEEGEPKSWIVERAKQIGYEPRYRAYPVIFWDLFLVKGEPIT